VIQPKHIIATDSITAQNSEFMKLFNEDSSIDAID
jgi:hypothetical protein